MTDIQNAIKLEKDRNKLREQLREANAYIRQLKAELAEVRDDYASMERMYEAEKDRLAMVKRDRKKLRDKLAERDSEYNKGYIKGYEEGAQYAISKINPPTQRGDATDINVGDIPPTQRGTHES